MKILFITPYQPNLVRVRPYQILRHLAKQGHEITLVYYDSEIDPKTQNELENFCNKVIAFKIPKWKSYLNAFRAIFSKDPLQAEFGWLPEMDLFIHQLLNKNHGQYDVIHVEHLRAAKYGLSILEKNSYHPPVFWDSVDSITHLFKQAEKKHPNKLARYLLGFEAKRTAKYEPMAASKFCRVFVTSPKDQNIYHQLLERNKTKAEIIVLPNGVDLEYFYDDPLTQREEKTIVISGKMSYHANQQMVFNFVEEILPKIWLKDPNVKLWIVGKDPGEKILSYGVDQRITVTGWVEDIRPYLQKATLAIAPLAYGAGIQNKILEAQACGTPVITSPSAIDALDVIPDEDLMVCDDADQFVLKVMDLITNPEKRKRIGKNGRLYVESNHSWDAVVNQLRLVYQSVL